MIRHSAALIALLLATCALGADVFRIGEMEVEVPAPADYVAVSEQMPLIQRFVAQMEDPVNDTLAVYISPEAAQAGLAGELPDLKRYFLLKVSKALSKPVVSVAQFEELRATVLSQQEQALARLQEQLPEMMAQIKRNLASEFGVDVPVPAGEIVPLGIARNDDNLLMFSMLLNMGADAGRVDNLVLATCTLLNVSGKVVFLYAYGTAGDQEWTEQSSAQWAGAILEANAPAPTGSAGGIDWGRVVLTGVAGAVIGSIVSLIIGRRRKAKAGAGSV